MRWHWKHGVDKALSLMAVFILNLFRRTRFYSGYWVRFVILCFSYISLMNWWSTSSTTLWFKNNLGGWGVILKGTAEEENTIVAEQIWSYKQQAEFTVRLHTVYLISFFFFFCSISNYIYLMLAVLIPLHLANKRVHIRWCEWLHLCLSECVCM